ncbi:MAG: 4-hydroxythreonine-4-phosphate dehydrogenase PdxA, partial [Candidatus Omnitrophica bacterium]|nr:4-hydroxythreonine-4-phosphate dehydrogenase PdxA [Candidatus Omnitrophota bacterium]
MSAVRVGITMGDPAGVGPEICTAALRAVGQRARFVVVGDRRVWKRAAGQRSQGRSPEFIDLANVDPKTFGFGTVKAEYGRASVQYLDAAMKLLRDRKIDCLVTCPISKEAVRLAGYPYSGHT